VIAALAATTHVPGMVLMRAPLGTGGSYVASGLNALQNVGFAVFELLVVAAALRAAVGGSSHGWVIAVTVASTALVLAGPLAVVRHVLRTIAVPLVLGAAIWLTIWAATRLEWPPPRRGHGGFSFWNAVDLAVAGMLSWAPLVPDYARFGRSRQSAFVGTALGSSLPALWFLALGGALAMTGGADPSVGFRPAVGAAALVALAVAELDKPFANLYSTVISLQNIKPSWRAPTLATVLGGIALAIALSIPLSRFETFLFLIGSCFVPLAGVLLGHTVARRRVGVDELYEQHRRDGRVRIRGFVPWLAGFAIYQWIAPSSLAGWHWLLEEVASLLHISLAPTSLSGTGASLPSFAVAFGLAMILTERPARKETQT
jgi:NCS1 family nucleobase:cation symporter-1